MSISLYKADAQTRLEWYKKLASTTFTFNDLVYIDANGYLIKAVDGVAIIPVGLIQRTITATSDDYASATKVPVLVGGSEAEYLCDVGTGTAAQTDIGEWIDIDDHQNVDVVATTYDIFFVTGIISTTKVIAKMAKKSGAAA